MSKLKPKACIEYTSPLMTLSTSKIATEEAEDTTSFASSETSAIKSGNSGVRSSFT